MLVCLSSAALAAAAPLTDASAPADAQVGTLDVTLSVAGTPDATLGHGAPYVVTVTCRTVAGTVAEGSLTFDGPATKTIGDLPVGATCTAVETTNGGADAVRIDPADGVTIAADTTAVITVVNTYSVVADPTTSTSTPRPVNLDGTPAAAAGPAPIPDDDGVPTEIEQAAPNGGDGNGDGVADAEQANVASLPSKYDVNGDGALDDYVTIESPGGTALEHARTLLVPADNPPPDGVALPAGLIDYDVRVVTPGDRADVRLFLPDGTQSAVYMLQNGRWSSFDDHAAIDDAADQVVLGLADGGAGDRSGTDGVIHDPVGIAAPAPLGSFTVRNDTVPEGTGQTFSIKLQSCGTGADPSGCADIPGKVTTLGDAVATGDEEFTFTGLSTTGGTWIRAVETVPAGWSVASVSCAGGSTQQTSAANAHGSVKVDAGGTGGGECSFVNTQNGTVTLVKQTSPDGSPTAFPVHLRRCGDSNNDNACSGGDPFVTPNNASLTDDTHQTWTAANITTAGGFAGRFELTENLPSGWTLQAVACTGGSGFSLKSQMTSGQRFYATSATPGIVCTFTNEGPRPGTITIKKDVSGGTDPADFAFTATGVTPTTFSLDDDGDNANALSNQIEFTGVPAGATYTFTETVPTGWLTPPSIACSGTTSEVVAGAQVSVPVTSGADITCTFTNTKLTDSTLTFHKRTLPAGTTTAFPFTLSSCTNSGTTLPTSCSGAAEIASASFATGDGSTTNHVVTPNGPTWYRLDETLSGWNLSDLVCTGASASGRDADDFTQLYVRVGGSQHADCTLTNAKAGTISILKQTLPDGSPDTFTFGGGRCGSSGTNCTGSGSALSPSTLSMTDGGSGTWTPGTANGNGRFRISETLPVTGWSVTSISCFTTDSSGQANFSTSTANKRVDFNMSSQATTSVVCTFTNGRNGTITVHKGGTRSPSGRNGTDYANGLGGASFQYSTTAAPNTWLPLCITNASGDCTGPASPVAAATYNVREQPGGSPAGWTDVQSLTYGGNGSGAGNSAHPYVGTAVVTAAAGPAEVTMASNPLVNGRGHQFVNIRNNPPLPSECGITIALILDRSGSIGNAPSSAQNYENAANGVIDTLAGTPTRIQVYSFTSGASAETGLLDLAQPGDAAAARTAITDVYDNLGGGSNFDAAFQALSGGFDAALILTDGNPTSWNGNVNTGGGSSTLNVIEASIASANTVKASAHVVAVGAGGGVTSANLAVISGPGDFVTNGLAGLQPTLDSIKNDFCGGRIIVQKETLPDGSAGSFPFTTSYGGGFSLSDGQSNDSGLLVAGTYSVAETTPLAWQLAGATCSDGSPVSAVQVDPGETVTCTFTNTKRPTITVAKSVTPAGGGPFGFTLTGTGGSTHDVTPGTPFTFGPAGLVAGTTYTLAEAADPGFVQAFTGCTYSVNGVAKGAIGSAGAGASVDLGSVPAGADVTCSFSNTERGRIVVEKETLPDGSPGSFPFTTSYGGGFSLSDGQSHDSGFLAPGTYSVAETTPAAWQLTGSTCSDGSPIGAIAVDPGETVTCTFTNTKRPTITVAKSVTPAGGGPFGFTLTGTGGSTHDVTPGTPFTFGPAGLVAGTSYGLAEASDPGYVQAFTGCTYSVNGVAKGAIGSPGAGVSVDLGSVPAGADVTCSFTNTERGRIVVEKETLPDGSAGSFPFTTSYGPGFSLSDGQSNDSGLLAPGTYSVAESTPAAWRLTGSTCSDGSPVSAVQVDAGETVTCTFTNAKRPTVTVQKSSAGGDGTFPFTLAGPGDPGSKDVTTVGGAGSATWGPAGLVPGGTYTLTETTDPAYVSTSLGCTYSVNGEARGPIGSPGAGVSVDLDSIPAGADVTCSFTNVRKARIQVRKVTDPAGQPDEFTFSLNSTPPQQVTAAGDDPAATGFPNLVPANVAYAVTETGIPAGPPAWDSNGGVCRQEVAGVPTGPEVNAASVTPGPGETWTCTFTNTKRATITVKKQTTPSSPTQGFDFTLSGGPTSADPITGLTSGNLNGQQFAPSTGVQPGTYTVAEVDIDPLWFLASVTCDRADVAGDDAKSPTNLQVKAGENWICTFQDTKYGQITVQKVTNPAEDPTSFDFAFTGRPGFQLAGGGSHDETLLQPGAYDITETVPAGWSLTGVSCDEVAQTPVNGKVTVNLAAGQNVTCTYTNTKLGQITVQKVTTPAQDPTEFDFTFTGRSSFQLAGGGSHDETLLQPGAYDITETVPAGWSLTGVTCGETAQSPVNGKITVNLAAGEHVTCTYRNLKLARITVRKATTPAQDPTPFAFSFTGRPGFQLPGGGSHDEANLQPGTYAVTESARTGWTLSGVVCDGVTQSPVNGTVTVVVAAGQHATCTYTNVLHTAPFTVLKDFSDDNPTAVSVSLQCTAGSVAGDSSASESDPAGFTVTGFDTAAATTCTATESNVPVGYSSFGSCSASLAAGSCTITNVLNTASFTVGKDFSDDNPADVSMALECSAGSVVDVDPTASEADPANFTVNGFSNLAGTTCTATESNVPASYTDSGPCDASLAVGACTITNTPVVVVAAAVTVVPTDSVFLRRALVAGESVQLTGRAPANCNPFLRIDGQAAGPVDTARNGDFDLSVATRDLATGKHVAEVVCKNRNAVLVRKTFWIAAPISSSNILFVALASLLVLFAIGWVAIRTLAGNTTAPKPVTT